MEVGAIPVAYPAAGGEEGGAVRAAEVEAVAAVGQLQVYCLGNAFGGTDVVFGTAEDGEEAQHEALVGGHVDVVEGDAMVGAGGVGQVEVVDTLPEDLVAIHVPLRALQEIVRFFVEAGAQTGGLIDAAGAADAHAPFAAEGVVEEGCVVADLRGDDGITPVDAVGRDLGPAFGDHLPPDHLRRPTGGGNWGLPRPRLVVAIVLEHLVALRGVGCIVIKPDETAVAVRSIVVRPHQVGPGRDVELRALPVDAVGAGGEGGAVEPAGHVPEFEQIVLRVVPGAVVEGRGHRAEAGVHLLVGFGAEHRALRMDFRFAIGACQGGLCDQEVVHEELAAEVDGDDLRGMGEIGDGDRLARAFDHVARRPGLREGDAVVEYFVGHGLISGMGGLRLGWRRGLQNRP